jgi:hypothetical protein
VRDPAFITFKPVLMNAPKTPPKTPDILSFLILAMALKWCRFPEIRLVSDCPFHRKKADFIVFQPGLGIWSIPIMEIVSGLPLGLIFASKILKILTTANSALFQFGFQAQALQ